MIVKVHQDMKGEVVRVEDMTPESAASEIDQFFGYGGRYTVEDLKRHGCASTPLKDWNLCHDNGKPVAASTSWVDWL